MSNRFSFSTADDLIKALQTANTRLRQKNLELAALSRRMGTAVQDDSFNPMAAGMRHALLNCEEISKQIDLITAGLGSLREKLYQAFTEDLVREAGLAGVIYNAAPRFGAAGKDLEHKNRRLAFQNEVTLRLRDRNIPLSVRRVYASVGSRCTVASEEYTGLAQYDPREKNIKFNLANDLQNCRGTLATYFHEVGHMIDHQAKSGTRLSDDAAFGDALRADCSRYIAGVQQQYACSQQEACGYICAELMSDVNLYSDISDIMGSLTDCACQNIWGHTRAYWRENPKRFRREAFANMYSAAMRSPQRTALLQFYFPTACKRFEQLLEEAL